MSSPSPLSSKSPLLPRDAFDPDRSRWVSIVGLLWSLCTPVDSQHRGLENALKKASKQALQYEYQMKDFEVRSDAPFVPVN
jgi:hypothetical protein